MIEPFKIETTFDKDKFIEMYKDFWHIRFLKQKKQLRKFALWSVVVLTIGILLTFTEDPENPLLFIGSTMLLFSFLAILFMLMARNKYNRKIITLANKYDETKISFYYEFTDEHIRYQDSEKLIEYKWNVFSYYSTYRNYLVIAIDDSLISYYIFRKEESDGDEFDKILAILNQKITFKKLE
jgi:hypothetical protein